MDVIAVLAGFGRVIAGFTKSGGFSRIFDVLVEFRILEVLQTSVLQTSLHVFKNLSDVLAGFGILEGLVGF